MKKLNMIVCALAALLSASCTMGYYDDADDIVGGRTTYYNYKGRNYMMNISDNLVTDILDELELALDVSRRGAVSSSHFVMDGPLTDEGSTWIVKAEDNALNGMTLHCPAPDCWTMKYAGEYTFSAVNLYPTTISVSAVLLDSARDTTLIPESEGWRVSVQGEREERGGYRCSFETMAPMDYLNTRGAGAKGWDYLSGDLYMTVYKDGRVVDYCCLSFDGSPSHVTFIRGL